MSLRLAILQTKLNITIECKIAQGLWALPSYLILPQLIIRLSTKNIKRWIVSLHDPNHWTTSTLWLYGEEVMAIDSSNAAGTWRRYQVEPTEVTHVNQVNSPCIPEEDNVTNIGECVTDYIYSATALGGNSIKKLLA